jgi:ribonucleoside-diphosphate reductase alpha chain
LATKQYDSIHTRSSDQIRSIDHRAFGESSNLGTTRNVDNLAKINYNKFMYNSVSNMKVIKRDGSSEDLNLDKIHKMVELACEGLSDVSPSYVETNSKLQFFDGITTEYIQNVLVTSANKLISLETPNYQYVAARLLLFGLYKSLSPKWQTEGLPSIYEHLNKYSTRYDSILLEKYTKREWDILDGAVEHIKDFKFTYASLQQLMDKYLIQDRSTGQVFETPQIAYMLIAATVFSDYPKETRLEEVIDYYHAISDHLINLPTPIMAGVRSKLKSFASCSLLDVDDTTLSIGTSNHAVGILTASSSGIGLNVGRMRSIDSSIRDGNVIHPGVIPFLKMFESTAKAFKQANRGGCFLKDTTVKVVDKIVIDEVEYDPEDVLTVDGEKIFAYELFNRLE